MKRFLFAAPLLLVLAACVPPYHDHGDWGHRDHGGYHHDQDHDRYNHDQDHDRGRDDDNHGYGRDHDHDHGDDDAHD